MMKTNTTMTAMTPNTTMTANDAPVAAPLAGCNS